MVSSPSFAARVPGMAVASTLGELAVEDLSRILLLRSFRIRTNARLY